jgi:hypothetical protein
LTLRVDADDEDTLLRLQNGITARVQTMGHRDQLTVTWQRPDSVVAPSGDTAHRAHPVSDTAADKPWWRRQLGTLGLISGGAVIIAMHFGVLGATLAASNWLSWGAGAIVAIILLKLVFLGGHVVLGGFAIRRRATLMRFMPRWMRRQGPRQSTPATPAAAENMSGRNWSRDTDVRLGRRGWP